MSSYHPYCYFEKFHPDLNVVLNRLKEKEFRAGRYDYALKENADMYMHSFPFPPTESSISVEPIHNSIQEALEDAGLNTDLFEGTSSILDVQSVRDEPEVGAAIPFPNELVSVYFDSTKPEKRVVLDVFQLERNFELDFWDFVIRKSPTQHYYIIIYDEDEMPEEVCFFGIFVDDF